MADNVTLNAGSGGVDLATDDIAGVHYQIAKLAHGALDSATIVSTASGLPVQQQGAFTVDLGATDNAVLDAIEADTTTLAGAVDGTEMQVDIVAALPAGTNNIGDVDVLSFPTSVHAEDFDTGGGTDNTLSFGIAVPASGGAVVVPGDATAGLKVNLGADNDVTVTGSVTANAGTNLNTSALALETGGNLATLAGAVNGTEMQVDVVTSALPTGAATAANQSTIIGHVDGIEGLLTTIDADTGGILTAVQLIDNAISGNEMQVDVVAALPAGTNSIGNVGLVPRTSGGMSIFRSIDIDETEEDVKTSAGQVFSITAFNRTAAPLYLKFYNATAANVTVGTTTPVLTFIVPGNADSDGAGFVWNNEIGFAFSTAISVAATTGIADNDTGAPGANDCIVVVGFA